MSALHFKTLVQPVTWLQ